MVHSLQKFALGNLRKAVVPFLTLVALTGVACKKRTALVLMPMPPSLSTPCTIDKDTLEGPFKFIEGGEPDHLLFSIRGVETATSLQATWIGVASRGADPQARYSRIFPGLAPDQRGCLFFTVNPALDATSPNLNYTATAALTIENTNNEYALSGALYCDHPDPLGQNKPGTMPYADQDAANCRQHSLVIATLVLKLGDTVTTHFVRTNRRLSEDIKASVPSAVRLPAGGDSVTAKVRATFFAAADKPGTWFPCGAAGCCRVFS